MVNRKCLGEVDSDPVTRGGLRLIPARAAATARGSVLLVQLAVSKKKKRAQQKPPSAIGGPAYRRSSLSARRFSRRRGKIALMTRFQLPE